MNEYVLIKRTEYILRFGVFIDTEQCIINLLINKSTSKARRVFCKLCRLVSLSPSLYTI